MSIDSYRQAQTQTASAALAEAAGVAGQAPSVHNNQPWRWRVDGDTLDLHAEPIRERPAGDPGGRTMMLSGGAALHHARIAMAAQGWRAEVDRMPDPDQPRLLARLRLSGRLAVTREALRSLHTIRIGTPGQRAVKDTAVASGDIDAIRVAVEAENAWLHALRPNDVLDLANAVDQAQTSEEFAPESDPELAAVRREEIAYWVGELRGSTGHGAVHAVLFGTEDTPSAWLQAGEALGAAWLTAIDHGLSVLPLSAVVEVEATRAILRRLLVPPGEPFLVLRFGDAGPEQGGPPHTPRLRSAQVVDVVESPRPATTSW